MKSRRYSWSIEYLWADPEERECFLDWLAFKFQKPAAILCGRSRCRGYVRHRTELGEQDDREGPPRARVDGYAVAAHREGYGADQTYNDWAAGCQFLIVDEAKDVSREDFWSAYETFKTRIDIEPGDVSIEC